LNQLVAKINNLDAIQTDLADEGMQVANKHKGQPIWATFYAFKK